MKTPLSSELHTTETPRVSVSLLLLSSLMFKEAHFIETNSPFKGEKCQVSLHLVAFLFGQKFRKATSASKKSLNFARFKLNFSH